MPNVQDIDSTLDIIENNVLNDCALPLKQFEESILDKILLGIFRSIIHSQIGFKSPTSGIKGLLEEGRYYMLSEDGMVEILLINTYLSKIHWEHYLRLLCLHFIDYSCPDLFPLLKIMIQNGIFI